MWRIEDEFPCAGCDEELDSKLADELFRELPPVPPPSEVKRMWLAFESLRSGKRDASLAAVVHKGLIAAGVDRTLVDSAMPVMLETPQERTVFGVEMLRRLGDEFRLLWRRLHLDADTVDVDRLAIGQDILRRVAANEPWLGIMWVMGGLMLHDLTPGDFLSHTFGLSLILLVFAAGMKYYTVHERMATRLPNDTSAQDIVNWAIGSYNSVSDTDAAELVEVRRQHGTMAHAVGPIRFLTHLECIRAALPDEEVVIRGAGGEQYCYTANPYQVTHALIQALDRLWPEGSPSNLRTGHSCVRFQWLLADTLRAHLVGADADTVRNISRKVTNVCKASNVHWSDDRANATTKTARSKTG